MQNLKHIVIALFITLLAFSAISYQSCKQDECKDVVCHNGGYCRDGVCMCPSGFTGKACDKSIVKIDPCEAVICENGGACDNGACTCPANYEGAHCESAINVKFAGSYNTLATCSLTGQDSYTVILTADATNPAHVLVSNLGNYSMCGTVVLDAAITKSGMMTIDDNVCGYHFVAEGGLSGNQINLTYTATHSADSETCTVTMHKQN